MKLIIAEKRLAAKRIAELLGDSKPKEKKLDGVVVYFIKRGSEDYAVIPLKGHIIDIDFEKKFKQWNKTDIEELIDAKIEKIEKEPKIIHLLKEFAKKANCVIFATDYDREGEAIAKEALEIIKSANPNIEVKRAVFSAITKKDLEKAFSELKELDEKLAESANARREIDLIWGASLTRFLSITSGRLGKSFISAGRVQSPTLAIIVEREKEIKEFKPEKYWEIAITLEKNKKRFLALHEKGRFKEKGKAEEIFRKIGKEAIVEEIKKTEKIISRPVPMNTTALLKEASALGISAPDAMNIAESLYQLGLISYPRTDNTAYPPTLELKDIVRKLSKMEKFSTFCRKILERGEILPSRGKQTKDHPPIHPVDTPKEPLPSKFMKIYELIVMHFLATLMEDAKVEITKVYLKASGEKFIASGKLYKKLGWKGIFKDKGEELLPEIKKGELLKIIKKEILEKETKPKPRYSQGSLIKLMEKLGLGTKATRHEIIRKLYARKYIYGAKSIVPSNLAFAVVEALKKHESPIIKPEMTAELERDMDSIASGKKEKNAVVEESKKMLKKVIKQLKEKEGSIKSELKNALILDKAIMKCPKCGSLLVIRKNSNGKRFLGCLAYPKCNFTLPLPQKGEIRKSGKKCKYCGMEMIKLSLGKRTIEICINPNCSSKKNIAGSGSKGAQN